MKIGVTPDAVWREYLRGDGYNRAAELYENVERNENFYIGNQWEGVSAPGLEKPVLNFLRRVVAYFISMIVSDDVAVSLSSVGGGAQGEFVCDVLGGEVEKVIEKTQAKDKAREVLRNAAVDGDGCFWMGFEPDGAGGGAMTVETVDNTNVLFSNPFVKDVQKQKSILVVIRKPLEEAREEARDAGCPDWEAIEPDEPAAPYMGEEKDAERKLVTVLLRMWKEDGTVRFCRCTKNVMMKEPADTGLRRYPLAWMNWETVKNSYHGQAALTGLIPNQIFVNKLWAMAMEHQKRLAFPKLFYDMTKIREWTNRAGEAVGVAGDPNTAIAQSFRAADMSDQVLELVDRTINYTRDFMGASDAALGNIRPDNTSAIIAVQKASSAPLELQRLAFYRFWEDVALVILDNIRAYYGPRPVTFGTDAGEAVDMVDFSAISYDALDIKVDVGAASYWSEIMQVETADNLFERGIVTDAITYLESVPDAYIRNKNKLIAKLREQQAASRQQAAALLGTPEAGNQENPGQSRPE